MLYLKDGNVGHQTISTTFLRVYNMWFNSPYQLCFVLFFSAVCLDLMQQMMSCWKRNEFKENTCQEEYLRYAECVAAHDVSSFSYLQLKLGVYFYLVCFWRKWIEVFSSSFCHHCLLHAKTSWHCLTTVLAPHECTC